MKHVLQHNLDLATSKQIADRALRQYGERYAKYEPKVRWVDDQRAEVSFTVKGIHIGGTVELRPGAVEIDLDVPFLFRAFKGPAIRVLDDELRKLIAEHQAKGQAAPAQGREPMQSRA